MESELFDKFKDALHTNTPVQVPDRKQTFSIILSLLIAILFLIVFKYGIPFFKKMSSNLFGGSNIVNNFPNTFQQIHPGLNNPLGNQFQNAMQFQQIESTQAQHSQMINPQSNNPQIHHPQMNHPQINHPQINHSQMNNPQTSSLEMNNPILNNTRIHYPQVPNPQSHFSETQNNDTDQKRGLHSENSEYLLNKNHEHADPQFIPI